MSTSSSQQPYQGYPYVKPFVVDAPSIDPATAARWTNLPRRPIQLPVSKAKENSVVYINSPQEGSSEDSETENRRQNVPRRSLPTKKEPDDAPVVYIDMPEQNGSDVAQNREDLEEQNEPAFVQETIFYDPFEDRRIDVAKDEEIARAHGRIDSESDEDSVSYRSGTSSIRRPRPQNPNSLYLQSAGASASSMSQPGTSSSTSNPRLPPMMSKEALIYGQQTRQDDGFPLSPIPVSEFPEPPPAYTEFDRTISPQPSVVEQPVRQPDIIPPRTQVILPRETISTPIGMPNLDRKYLNCHHCGMRVHTLVIKENGCITHTLAILCFVLALFPLICLIYCTDYFKVKNHYCPMCSQVIGYELPFNGGKIYYVN